MLTPRHKEMYDAFEHLRRSLFSPKGDLFTMLAAYFDDSGTGPSEPVGVVAGYIATVEMWKKFNERWAILLHRSGIKQVHRADLESGWGEFKGWNPSRRTEFVKKAHAIIRRYTYSGFGFAVIKSDFKEVFSANPNPYAKYPIFGWCVQGCLAGIKLWCDAKGFNTTIQYVFEAGTAGQADVNKFLSIAYSDPKVRAADRMAGWSFQGKEVLPLQAADVLAYEFYKFNRNELIDHGRRPIRPAARDLLRQHELDYFRHFEAADLKKFVENWDADEKKRLSTSF